MLLALSTAALAQPELEDRGGEDAAQTDADEAALEAWILEVRESPLFSRESGTFVQETSTLDESFENGAEYWNEMLEGCDVSAEVIAEADDMEQRLREMIDRNADLSVDMRDLPAEIRKLWSELTGLRAQQSRNCCEQSNRICAF
jgi:hypothetical protein